MKLYMVHHFLKFIYNLTVLPSKYQISKFKNSLQIKPIINMITFEIKNLAR